MKNKKKVFTVIAVIFVIAIVFCGGAFALNTMIMYERHKVLFDVTSITAYDCPDNDDYFRFEIKGTAKTWFFDDKTYDNVYLDWSFEGGELCYDVLNGKSNVFSVSHKKSDFNIIFDINKSDMSEAYVKGTRFDLYWAENGNSVFDGVWAMFMQDYYTTEVEWKTSST